MRKKPSTSKYRRAKRRPDIKLATDAASQTLRDAKARSSEPAALRLVSLDADCAHLTINRAVSTATALKILEVLRQDHAGDE